MATLSRIDDKLLLYTDYLHASQCKSILGGVWNKRTGCWEYPIEALPYILKGFPRITLDATVEPIKRKLELRDREVQDLLKGAVEPRKHTFLMRHQRLGRDLAQYFNKFAMYYDVGTGKTILAYSIIEERLADKWLVISPKTIIKAAWVQDGVDFFPGIKVLPVYADGKTEMYKAVAEKWGVDVSRFKAGDIPKVLMQHADVVVTNVEFLKSREFIAAWPHQGLIIDESSMLRNKETQNTKALVAHADKLKYAYLLSGKPAPNSELEYFSQMLIVNRALFGKSYYSFRAKFFEAVDYFQRDFKMKPFEKEEFTDRLSRGCIFIRKEDCLDLPPELPPMMRVVTLSDKAKKYYRDMERERVVALDDKYIAAALKVSSIMKLRQITSGFIIDTENEMTERLHKEKLNELADVITELGDNNAVIWINFKQEVLDICELLTSMGKTYATAYGGTASIDDSIEAFKSDKAQFMIANPKSLKFGVTFTGPSMKRNCTYSLYYSMSHSYEDYYQSKHRIYRKGQTESCTYIYIIADNTIDMDIYDSIVRKGTDSEIIENMVRRLKDG